MSGEKDLSKLLKSMSPVLDPKEYVFITINKPITDCLKYNPISIFMENEGTSLIIPMDIAIKYKLEFENVFKKITLNIHSSLSAVGLTAAISNKLKDNNISANVVAGYYHDHIFVQSDLAKKAIKSLEELSNEQPDIY